jgi:hypothetical protein
MLINTVNDPRIVCVHGVAQYDIGMGMDDNEWTCSVFDSVGDVHGPPTGAGHINIVNFPNDAFHLTGGPGNGANLLRVPPLMILDAAFAEGPNVQNVGLFDNDIGTDVLRTRYFIYIPVKYFTLLHLHTCQVRSHHLGATLDSTSSLGASRWRYLRRQRC